MGDATIRDGHPTRSHSPTSLGSLQINDARSGDEAGMFFGSGDAEASFPKSLRSEVCTIYIYIYTIFLHLY